MAKARMGVIGAGWWATQFHIPSLKTYERADIVGIADVKPEKAAAAADYYDVRNTYDDHRELLAAGVDGVVIAVQHAYHYEVARDALDAGVHVLVEKPMTLTAADAWDLVERAKSNGLHLMVGYTYQFTRHAQAAREIVQSGRIGELQLVSGVFTSWVESYLRGKPQDYAEAFAFPVTGPEPDSYSDPRMAGGGQGHLQVTHPMGMALWVTERRAAEVFAFMESYDLDVDLVDSFGYRLDNGASGTMASTGAMRPHQQLDQTLLYAGSGGFVRQDLAGGRLEAQYNDGTSERFPDLSEEELYPAHLPSRGLTDLALGAVENRAPGELGARVVEFLEAGYRSAASGRSIEVIPSHRDATVYVRPGSGFPPRIEYGAGSSRE